MARYVEDSFDSLHREAAARVFLPLLVERFCRERLQALALANRRGQIPRPQVLFVCSHNAGRSQRYEDWEVPDLLPGFRPHVPNER